jgi:hypothetical protein
MHSAIIAGEEENEGAGQEQHDEPNHRGDERANRRARASAKADGGPVVSGADILDHTENRAALVADVPH